MMKIDYVVTYLDPTDQYWREQFAPYAEEQFKIQPERYDENGKCHLKYHFRGIAKHMPWLNNVYLVVFSESQVPEWVNRDTVKIVTDDMFIPKKFLPTFNSCTKQLHLHLIPNMEEHFLFASDDVFSINNLTEHDFFDNNGHPKTINFSNQKQHIIKKPLDLNANWERIHYNSQKFANILVGKTYDENFVHGIPFTHWVRPALKSDLLQWYMQNTDEISNSITITRSGKNISGDCWTFANGWKYMIPADLKLAEKAWYHKNEVDVIKCKNDGVHLFTLNYTSQPLGYISQFEKLFPKRCKYEK